MHYELIEATTRVMKAQPGRYLALQLCRCLHLSATDLRDKIFSLLGIIKFTYGSITADYTKPVEEFFTEAMIMMLRQHELMIYAFAPLQPLRNTRDSIVQHPCLLGCPTFRLRTPLL